MNNNIDDISIQFIGPDIQVNNKHSNARNSYQWKSRSFHIDPLKSEYKTLLHNIQQHDLVSDNDVFVLFNPGLGSNPQKRNWDTTISRLLVSGKPIVLTAHGPSDLKRDIGMIEELVNNTSNIRIRYLVAPRNNPYHSFRQTIDSNESGDDTRIVTTNHSVYCVQLDT